MPDSNAYITISLKHSDFIQTYFKSEKRTIGNYYYNYITEKYEKICSNEKWYLTVNNAAGIEFAGDYVNHVHYKVSNFKIETERKFIFWRKKTIFDLYSFEGDTHFLKNILITDLLMEFKSDGIEVNKEGAKIHFRVYVNFEFTDKVFENIKQLIQELSMI
jgi:hypothetical protein